MHASTQPRRGHRVNRFAKRSRSQQRLNDAMRPVFDNLERRQLLTTFFVNDNWVVTSDNNNDGYGQGDIVENTGFGDDGSLTGLVVYDQTNFPLGTAFDSIAGALQAATSGDIIRVISGSYSTLTTVNVANVTLQGDNFGTAGTGVRVPETVLNGPVGSLSITANNVVVDGFMVRDALIAAGTGITVGAVSGTQVINNIVTQNATGVLFNGSGTFTASNNKFDSNNRAGPTRGQAVRVVSNTGTGTIQNNTFIGHTASPTTGAVTLVSAANVAIGSVGNGNSFGTNALDVRIGVGTTLTTIAGNTFAVTSTTYINNEATGEVNAAVNSYDGVTPNLNTNLAQQNAIVDKIVDGVDAASRGLVRINPGHVYVTAASFFTPTTTTPNIQRGVNVAVNGDIIHVQSGTYTGSVSTAGKNVTLSPGASTGIVTITGDLTLDSTDTLLMEVNGLTAGTGHDQLVVNGLVTLGGAALSTTGSTIVATVGDQIQLISNDLVDAVTGTFNGLSNGDTVTVAGQPFAVFYTGGTGNDVVLVRVPAAGPPAVVWVDDDYIGETSGNDADLAGPNGTSFGFDQFDNIQDAIDAVASGGTIHVAAGGYAQNIIVDKAVSILGPNALITGYGSRVTEAVVTPENSEPDPTQDPASVIFYITVSGVTIKGLTVDGDNASINSGVTNNANLADIDAIEGISSYEGVGNTTIENNIVRNVSYTGINFTNFYNSAAATSGNTIKGNLIQNVGGAETFVGYGTGAGVGILTASNFYADVTENSLAEVVIGIQTGDFNAANPGSTGSIDGNLIDAERMGIWINDHSGAASTISVTDNDITGYDTASPYANWDGVLISAISGAADVTISGNDIDGTGITKTAVGYGVWGTSTSADLRIVGGTVTGVETGVHANNFDSFNANSANTEIVVDGVDISADSFGVFVDDDASNTNSATVTVTVTGGTEIQDASSGVFIAGADASATIELSDIHDTGTGVSIIGGLATVSGNQIYNNNFGIEVASSLTGSLVSQNLLNNSSADIVISPGATATSVRIHENSLEGTLALFNTTAATIQASGNWWGTTSNPQTALRISGGNVDYSPWMYTGVDFDLDPANGFQGIFDVLGVDDNSPQSAYLSLAAGRINEAIAQVETGGTLQILAGSYSENVSTAGKSVALSPGDSGMPEQITISGDLTMDANDFLVIEVGGTTPGTQHDQVVVTGTATLGNASLVPVIAYLPGPTDVITAIDAVTLAPGTFAGLAQGASIGDGFRVDYNAALDEVRFVQNTPFVIAEANGPYGINEGQSVTLSSAGSVDPDAFLGDFLTNWDWDLNNDSVYGDVTGANPTVSWATLQSFGINDNGSFTIGLRVTNNLGETGTDTATINVANVAPTIAVTGAASSNEGSTYSLTLGSVVDPGADTISSYRINWGDGSPLDIYTPAQVLLAGGVLKHVYVDDNPTVTSSDPHTITVDLQDEDNSPSYYASVTSKTIAVNNVNPAPTIVGAPAQSSVNVPITVTGNPNDPGINDTFTYSWSVVKSGFGLFDSQVGPSSTFDFTPDSEATYTISLTVTDDDSGVGNAVNVQVIAVESLKVINFTSNNSGFSVQLNRPVDLDVLNLYDGSDVPVDAADVTVIGALNPGNPIRGSLVWDAATNTAHWVATGGVLPADTYTITLFSGATRWTADSGPNPNLDGDGNGIGGDNYTNGFVIAPAATRVVQVQDFARGPSQTVKLPFDNTAGAGLPVRVDNAQNVTAVDFRITYNPQLLNITAVAKASNVPADWAISSSFDGSGPIVVSPTEWYINVTVFTTLNTVLSASVGAADVVQFTANVPASSGYGIAQVVRISNVDVAISNVASGGRGDNAVHKVIYIGDADGDTVYTGSDAGVIAGVVVGPHNGFDIYDLTDPNIIADVDGNGSLTGNDASWVAQKSVFAPRPEIPNRPPGTPPVAIGLDPTIDIPDGILANPGSSVNVPIMITDSANGLVGFSVSVSYNNSILSLTNGLGSPDVTLGSLFSGGGWTVVSNVEQANGLVHLTFFRSNPFVGGAGTIANLNMAVSNAAPVGITNVTSSGYANQGGFAYTYLGGSVNVTLTDFTGPALPVMTFVYDSGAPMRVTAVWAENVSGPKTMTLTNLTTASATPVTLNYSPNTGTYTFPSFGSGILPNGNYQAVINAADVTDGSANPMVGNVVFNFFVLAGDANRDRVVDARDMLIMSNNWFGTGKTFSQGDFNYDGVVNQADLTILSQNWQQTLPASPAAPLSAPAPTTTTAAPSTGRSPVRNPTRTPAKVIDLVQ